MAKPDRKKSKSDGARPKRTDPIVPLTNDPRFATVHSDPRFALPKKRDRTVTVDSRFKKVLEDDEFTRKAKVDKYGRRLAVDKRREEIKKLYTFEDDNEDEDEDDAEGGVKLNEEEKGGKSKKKELKQAKGAKLAEPSDDEEWESESEGDDAAVKFDPARGEGMLGDSSSDDSSSEDDDDSVIASEAEEAEAAATEADEIPLGDVTSRIAVVNLDWDHVKSTDLYVVLSSFVPPGGKILNVSVYPSEFGKERMEREEMEGPPKEMFGISDKMKLKKKVSAVDEEEDDQTEITEQTLVKEDTGEEIDSAALRRYQLERLRYFYAIVTCDSPASANAIYAECDGAEYGTTANFFDLRFVPDGTDFDDRPRDECNEMPKRYKPLEFSTDALQHSKVKLTWDQEDTSRKAAVKEAFSRREVEDMDLQAYLASDSDDDNEEAREAYRKLLNLAPSDDKPAGGKDKGEKPVVGDMEVTFSAALTAEEGAKEEIFERDETTMEKYIRKERDRKKARKEKMKEKREVENGLNADSEDEAEPKEDLGFDDPFFENPEKANAESKKAKKAKKKEDREKVAADQASKRDELETLMAAGTGEDASLQHFNMNDIRKREKLAKLKGKAAKRMAKKKGMKEAEGLQDGYKMDVSDPRFSAIYEKTEFAIDPTNPRFKKTKAMDDVMQERRKRRAGDDGEGKKFKRRK